jgi:hypothetical protein
MLSISRSAITHLCVNMHNFSKYIKKLKFDTIKIITVKLSDIKAQYNPDRFEILLQWSNSFLSPLDIAHLPHVQFIQRYRAKGEKALLDNLDETSYYKLQREYGKSIDTARVKCIKFMELFASIIRIGIKENPIILDRPLIQNPYNKGWEIFEGHHRLAILYCLCIPTVKVELKSWSNT